jgi:3-carboxy-cis,cis-muconate cycloisomerase
VTDTALVLCLRRAAEILHRDHQRLTAALRRLSDRHHDTVMLARTLLQPATPTTFGLKAAGWFAGVAHAHAWMARAFEEARVLQFGGPAGTLAVLGEHGPAIAERMAIELELTWPGAPWHTDRHRFAAVAAACGIYTGALGKIARDVALLMQFEVGEAAEPGGGSSSMPHKRNPAACALILAAAARVPALAATLFSTMTQEHERGVGGWHAEAITLADIVQTTGSALAGAADVAEHLTVDADRMRRNLEAARGTVFPGSDAPDTHLGSAEVFRRRLLDRN